MDRETQARWDAWAKAIARREILAAAKETGRVMAELLKQRDDRIAELERRVGELEKATTGDNGTEWPIPERNAA